MNIHGLKKKRKRISNHLKKIRNKKASKSHIEE